MEGDQVMEVQRIEYHKRVATVCSWVMVGLLPLSGCAWNRTMGDNLPEWMRPSSPATALSAPQCAAAQTPAMVARPVIEAPVAADAWSPPPGPNNPAITFVSQETIAAPASEPARPVVAAPVKVARAEPRPAGRAVAKGVVHANDRTFDQQVIYSDVPVLVDFYASWCGPCKKLAPTLDEVAAESPRARVVKVNIDDSPAIAARYGVQSVPSLIVFKDGQVVARQTGAVSKNRLKGMLDL
jgi:thioredoxin 1